MASQAVLARPESQPGAPTRTELIAREQLRHLDRAITFTPFVNALAGSLLVYAMHDKFSLALLLGWLLLLMSYHIGRLALSRHLRNQPPSPQAAARWIRTYTWATLLSGCIWGSTGWLFYTPESMPHQALLISLLIGMCAGSVTVNTAYSWTNAAFAVPGLAPLILSTALQGGILHTIIAMLLAIFLAFTVVTGRAISALILESLTKRFENSELIEQLKMQKNEADRARSEAEEANRAKSRFLAAASHDLRQPLHALGLFTGVLEQSIRYPEVRSVVLNMKSSVESLDALFNELLDISRLDAGVITPKLEDIELQPILQRIHNDFAPLAQERGLRLQFVNTSCRTRGDATLLERIVRNLVANAIRYTKQGEVLVGCRRRAENMLSLQVWDTGVGIAPAERERVFEEFYQIGNRERDRSKGLGLGLAIVKRLAQLLGYSVRIDSEPERGSCFSVLMPRLPPAIATDRRRGPGTTQRRSALPVA